MDGLSQLMPMLMAAQAARAGQGGLMQQQEQPNFMQPPDIMAMLQNSTPAGAMPGFDPTALLRGMRNPFGAM